MVKKMADLKKLVSLENLTSYDTLIKKYIGDADAVVNAKSIKTILWDATAEQIKFYKKENATLADVADYSVSVASSDVDTLKAQMSEVQGTLTGYSSTATVASAIAKTAQDAADAVSTLENGQVKTNKEAIDAINDSTSGILATAKKYTDDEAKKINDKIGTVADDTTVVDMIADAKKAGTDAQSALDAYKTINDVAVAAAKKAGDDAQADVDALENVVGDMTSVKTTAKTVAGAVDELKDAIDSAAEAGKVTINASATPTDGYLKTYVFSQAGSEIGKIDIPKDLVVTAGEVVVDPDGMPAGTYIKLTIANQDNPIFINVRDLVEDFTVASGATEVQLAVTAEREISATLVDGGVATAKIADGAVTTAKIADTSVTKAKLAADVQSSLEAADAAAQAIVDAIEALDAEKSQTAGADGLALSISEVDGKITSISGSIAANTYDAYGSAKAVQNDLDAYKYDVATTTDINKLFSDAE